MLTKDVKDILEGVYFFLREALNGEHLSGKVECMRGGLILQLEALRQCYPTLHFSSNDTPVPPPPPYVEHPNNAVVSSRLSTCSGGSSTNYSSTGYSNSSSTGYSEEAPLQEEAEEESYDSKDEIYEEYEDVINSNQAKTPSKEKNPKIRTDLSRSNSKSSQSDRVYENLIDVDPVSFRVLILRCVYHGVLTKRSKHFLRNSRFHAVIADSFLYFYHKDTDDQQKKVIDLAGYTVQNSSVDDTRSSKKKNFGFELSADGKKTQAFLCSSERERNEWVNAIKSAIACHQIALELNKNNSFVLNGNNIHRPPPPLPIVPLIQPLTPVEEANTILHESSLDEYYEELNSDCEPLEGDTGLGVDKLSDYRIPADEEALPPRLEERTQRIAPERPPLPNILKKQARPLPEAPMYESYDRPEEDLSIYCEIDEDEEDEDLSRHIVTDGSRLIPSRSLSQEIFDTIKERGSPLPNATPLLRDAEDCELNYDVPLESVPIATPPKLSRPSVPPPLPSKKVPVEEENDDLEYKVPSSVLPPQSIYQVPSSQPVRFYGRPEKTNLEPLNVIRPPNEEVTKSDSTSPKADQNHDKTEVGIGPSFNSVKDRIALLNRCELERNSARSSLESKYKAIYSKEIFVKDPIEKQKNDIKSKVLTSPVTVLPSQENPSYSDSSGADVYIAKFAFVSTSDEILSFNRGEEIVVRGSKPSATHWSATIKGKEGLVPKDYLRKRTLTNK